MTSFSCDFTHGVIDRDNRSQPSQTAEVVNIDLPLKSGPPTQAVTGAADAKDSASGDADSMPPDLKRIKGNIASQISRLKRKQKNESMERLLEELEQENKRLKREIERLEMDVTRAKSTIKQRMNAS